MNRLRLEVSSPYLLRFLFPGSRKPYGSQAILAFPQLAKYDKQWPAIDLVRQYLENSASYRTKKVTHSNTPHILHWTPITSLMSQATVVLKKRLSATKKITSQVRKNGMRDESPTVKQMTPAGNSLMLTGLFRIPAQLTFIIP